MLRRCFSLCALLLIAVAPTADAQIYLRLAGEFQGPIDGDVVFGPLTGTIATTSFSLGVSTPIDPSTGLPAGPIDVSPLLLMKGTDSATTRVLTALRAGEGLTTCILDAYRNDGAGAFLYLRLTLTGARIESWQASASGEGNAFESLSIVFDTLEWRDFVTGDVYDYTMGSTSVVAPPPQFLALATAPNPTGGPTEFSFRLPETGSVSIKVYDARGRHVVTVFDGEAGSERGVVAWDGRDTFGQPVANGIYMVKMQAGGWLTTNKMSVLR